MPGTATYNYAETVGLEFKFDPALTGAGQVRATYVVGYQDPVSGARAQQQGTAKGNAVVVPFGATDAASAILGAVREAIRAREGLSFSATPPDQVLVPTGAFS